MSDFDVNLNFYETLGLKEDADSNQIRKAYKKLALKWHPDKNSENKEEAEKKFKEISEAYSVLSDENKKREYDDYRKHGGNKNMGGENFDNKNFSRKFSSNNFNDMDARDIFKEFFGGKDPFENFGKFGFGFDDEDDMFGKGFGKSPFENDDFFNGMGNPSFMQGHKMGGMGNFPHMDMGNFGGNNAQGQMANHGGNSMSRGMGGGTKTSIRKTTQTINGRRVTRTEKTIIDANGNSTSEITEEYN